MLHIAVILYDDKQLLSRINVMCGLTPRPSFVNNVWSGTRPKLRVETITIKAPPNGVFALNHVQLCRHACI